MRKIWKPISLSIYEKCFNIIESLNQIDGYLLCELNLWYKIWMRILLVWKSDIFLFVYFVFFLNLHQWKYISIQQCVFIRTVQHSSANAYYNLQQLLSHLSNNIHSVPFILLMLSFYKMKQGYKLHNEYNENETTIPSLLHSLFMQR